MIMKKNGACQHCKGNGYITVMTGDRNDYCGVVNEMCTECGGTGVNLVEATKADHIRSMNDEEMANAVFALYNKLGNGAMNDLSDLFCDGQAGCIAKSGEVRCSEKKVKSCILRWLQSPAEEGDNGR